MNDKNVKADKKEIQEQVKALKEFLESDSDTLTITREYWGLQRTVIFNRDQAQFELNKLTEELEKMK